MRKTLVTALLVAGLATPLAAQTAPAATPAQPAAQAAQQQAGNTPEDRTRASLIFRTFSIALNSDKVDTGVKNRLLGCLYNNSMRKLSVATGAAFARNKALDPKKPEHVYAVASQICGVQPAQQAAQQAAPAPAQSAAPTSR